MTAPASHRSDVLTLPDIPVSVIDPLSRAHPTRTKLSDALCDWYRGDASNLLLVMGEFGTGKTTGLVKFSSTLDAAHVGFDQIRPHASASQETLPHQSLMIFDNFDAINNLAGTQVENPDLRQVRHLAHTHRVILATRRSPHSKADELLGQVTSQRRLAQLGFKQPTIIHLLPWDLRELQEHAQQLQAPDKHFEIVVSYLESTDLELGERLRRPLLINMLMQLARDRGNLTGYPTIASLYQEYFSLALAADYDAQRSRISSRTKQEILADLAYDIFSGTAHADDSRDSVLYLPIERVSERVFEALMRTSSPRRRPGIDDHRWTEDFLSSNHIFEEVTSTWTQSFSEPQYGFVHPSYYEYFVSLALCRSIGARRTLGLEIDRLSMATVDSLAFAFTKEIGGSSLRDAVREIVLRPRLTVADRLILFYFLEDESDFADLLAKTPSGYLEELGRLEESVESFFLKKMIRYQLVVTGKYDPDEYVAELRKHEDEGGLQAEVRLHSAETNHIQQLLHRLKNEALQRAQPITIYRLGQLGDDSAIESLEMFASAANARLKRATRKAIDQIRQRTGQRK